MKKILVLGSGLVAEPLIRYLLEQSDFRITVASLNVDVAERIINRHPNGKALYLDIRERDELDKLVSENNIVISLLPFTHHTDIARLCIKNRRSMVTTSYVSEAIAELDSAARDAGVVLLNEMGLDPGIDHMSAMRIIDDVSSRGGQIEHFRSYCGGLPAPEANDNPLGYKFSWSPRGVVMAGRNDSHYLEDGKEVFIAGKDLFRNCYMINIPTIGRLEAYPNRNSVPYKETYGIGDAKTMYRGTLRNVGWCETLRAIADMGYLDETKRSKIPGNTYADLTRLLIGASNSDLRTATAGFLELSPDSKVMERLQWLGLFDNEVLPEEFDNALDYLTAIMKNKMYYKENERDMIILYHDFRAGYPDGRKEHINSSLIAFGIPGGDTAMSRTVSLPAAIGAKYILEGSIKLTGVRIPVYPEIYIPVLDELENMGIRCKEKIN
ncbi:MAG: saccharopine dehydrogenase [candidate division Zixibacteria bacterium]|nr:saccharopine dehydrogenase [candidate division Zixibacteria bacterium]